MSLVFFFLRNVPISGLCLPKVGEGEEGEEREEDEEEADNAGGGSPLSVGSVGGSEGWSSVLDSYPVMEMAKFARVEAAMEITCPGNSAPADSFSFCFS